MPVSSTVNTHGVTGGSSLWLTALLVLAICYWFRLKSVGQFVSVMIRLHTLCLNIWFLVLTKNSLSTPFYEKW